MYNVKNIFLIGYMGVGKTTIGKLLSAEMNMEFIDLDKYIENRYRKTIQELFDKKGESGFKFTFSYVFLCLLFLDVVDNSFNVYVNDFCLTLV